jgi:hypothetical protein
VWREGKGERSLASFAKTTAHVGCAGGGHGERKIRLATRCTKWRTVSVSPSSNRLIESVDDASVEVGCSRIEDARLAMANMLAGRRVPVNKERQ